MNRHLLSLCAVGIAGVLVGVAASSSTDAAFSDFTSNAGNSFSAAAEFEDSEVSKVKSIGTASCGNESNSLSVPAGGVAVGNTLVARLAHRTTINGGVTIFDSEQNNWTKDADVFQGNVRIVVFSAYITNALAQSDQITVTFPPVGDAVGLTVEEFSGIAATNRVDAIGTASGDSASPSATLTTTNGNDLLYGAVANFNNRTHTDPVGWTTGKHQAIDCGGAIRKADNHGASRQVLATSSYTYNPMISSGEKWAAAVVAYRAASGAPSCNRPAATYLSGYEYGPVAFGTIGFGDGVGYAGGVPIIESAVKRSGTYSLKVPKGSAGASYASKNLPSSTIVLRHAVSLASLPSTDVAELVSVVPAAGSALNLGYNASQNKFQLAFGSGSAATATTAVQAGTWHVIEMKVDMAANPRTVSWRIDGSDQPQASSTEGASSVASVRLGSTVAADVFTANYDDVLVSASGGDYPIGDGRVLGLRPDGMSSHSSKDNFSNDDGSPITSTSYQRLDDDPWNSTTDFIQQTGTPGGYVGITFADPTQTCIRGVAGLVAYDSGGPGNNNGKTSIFDGTAERIVYSGDMTTGGPPLRYRDAVIAPASSFWSQSAVSGLIGRIGFSSDAGPVPRWHAVMLEYETPP
jgi:hypothetical protein